MNCAFQFLVPLQNENSCPNRLKLVVDNLRLLSVPKWKFSLDRARARNHLDVISGANRRPKIPQLDTAKHSREVNAVAYAVLNDLLHKFRNTRPDGIYVYVYGP